MWKKYIWVIGGNTGLGKNIVKTFKPRSVFSRWRTFNIDFDANLDASENHIIDPTQTISEQAENAVAKAKEFVEEYDAIIIPTPDDDFQTSNIKDIDIFEKYEEATKRNVYPSMIAARIAGELLAPWGLMVFQSSLEAFEKTNPDNFAVNLSKMQVWSTALNIAEFEEVPQNCQIVTILPSVLNTATNRNLKKGTQGEDWEDVDQVTSLIKMWWAGESRPENRAFITFQKASKKILLAKYG